MLSVTIIRHSQNEVKIVASGTGKTIPHKYASREDYGAQAAAAVYLAQNHNDGEYLILGPDEVMNLIPEKIRSK